MGSYPPSAQCAEKGPAVSTRREGRPKLTPGDQTGTKTVR